MTTTHSVAESHLEQVKHQRTGRLQALYHSDDIVHVEIGYFPAGREYVIIFVLSSWSTLDQTSLPTRWAGVPVAFQQRPQQRR